MDNNNSNDNNKSGGDYPGELFSWIIIFILMFAFWPLGLIMLLRKLRSYAKNPHGRQRNQQVSYAKPEPAAPVSKPAVPVSKSVSKPEKKKNAKQSRLENKSGKLVSTVLLLISIALFIIGANTVVGAARDISAGTAASWPDLSLGAFYFAGGFASFFARSIGARRLSRFKRYYALIGSRSIVPIPDIAAAAGESEKSVRRGLQAMIDAGYLEPGAYIDAELNSLALSAEAAELLRKNTAFDAGKKEETPVQSENQYMVILRELRELNTTIIDGPISDKIDKIELLTAKIFREVEQNPSKQTQIRRFMSYYLPTTLKLLHSYATLEKQGIKGENIVAAKENISKILDTLSSGFEQQLDILFRDDAIDISADVSVIESMMRQDGLAQ